MDLFDLTAKITLDTSGYEQGVGSAMNTGQSFETSLGSLGTAASQSEGDLNELGSSAEGTGGKFDAISVAVGNFVAGAISNLISKVGEAAKEIVQLGIETETAFAKLETISGQENIDSLTGSIRELSVQSGVSAADLADVAYNAISAGADASNAMEMVEAATKLGVAGFTESSSALSVLSTAMNSYGDECGTAMEISDSLIMTQNLGVTTVDELAGSIGRVIGVGAAYNVSLENIEAGYVALTKSGLNTRIATTYLSSALSELGDSGSTVSSILTEVTGQSFAELMESGESLGDVMGILHDYVDNDNTAFMELWSSSNAALAAADIINQGVESFDDSLEQLQNSAGATEEAYSIMSDTIEFKTNQMNEGFAAIGLAIFDGLDTPMSNSLDFINGTFIPGLMGILDGSVDTWDAVSDIFEGGQEIVTETLTQILENLPSLLAGIVEFLIASLPSIEQAGLEMLTGIVQALPQTTSNLVAALPDLISSCVSGLIGHAPDILAAAVELFMAIVQAIPQITVEVVGAIPDIIAGIVQGLLSGAGQVLQAAMDLGSNILNGIKSFLGISSPSTVMEEQGEYITEGLVEGITSMPMQVEAILAEVEALITNWGSNLSTDVAASALMMVEAFGTTIGQIPVQLETELTAALTALMTWGSEMTSQSQSIAEQLVTTITTQVDTLPGLLSAQFSSILTDFTSFGSNWTSSATQTTTSVLSTFQSFGNSWLSNTTQFTNNVQTAFTTFFDTWIANFTTATTEIETINTTFNEQWLTDTTTLTTELTTALTEFHTWWQTTTTETTTAIQTTITTMLTSIQTSFTTTLEAIKTAVTTWGSEVTGQFKTVGENAMNGLVQGLAAGEGAVYTKVREIARKMVSEMESELDIGSPSKVFRFDIGEMVGEGLALGIEDSMDSVESAMDDLMSITEVGDQVSAAIKQYNGKTAVDSMSQKPGITVVQNIYSEAKTAAELMREARYQQQRAVLMGV